MAFTFAGERSSTEFANGFSHVDQDATMAAAASDRVPSQAAVVAYIGSKSQPNVKAVNASSSASVALTAAQSGQAFLVDRATLVYTLPAASSANIGVRFTFVNTINATSQKIAVNTAASEFVQGTITMSDGTKGDSLVAQGNGTSHVAVEMVSTATGGLLGGQLEFTLIKANLWQVTGVLFSSASPTTPFTTSV